MEITYCESSFIEALVSLKTEVENAGATVTYDPLPTVMARPLEMVQLFQNLVGNAIKYRDKESPMVHVASERIGNEWQLSVSDNGIGIDPQYFNQIFLPFKRLHTHEAYPGTGIGLAICKKIVEGYGGRIWVASELGNGSRFVFTIPSGNS